MVRTAKYLVLVEATRDYATKPPAAVDRKANALQQRTYWALTRACTKTPLGWVADEVALGELAERFAPLREDAEAFNREHGPRGWRIHVGVYPVPLRSPARVEGFPTAWERIAGKEGEEEEPKIEARAKGNKR